MPYVSVNLDTDLNARASKYAKGVGVSLDVLITRALKYALSSRYPVDPGYGVEEGGKPDQGLPGEQPEIDNGLPPNPFNPEIDNSLPEGEIPTEINPNPNPNPDVDVDVDRDAPRPGQELPETPEPKA